MIDTCDVVVCVVVVGSMIALFTFVSVVSSAMIAIGGGLGSFSFAMSVEGT